VADEQKKEELDIFHKWRATQDKKHFQALYTSMKPLLYSAAKKASYGSNIPESAYRIYAAQSFLNALKTFDPSKGGSLQTHVYGSVHQKTKRLNYDYQNLSHTPEPRAVMVGLYQTELSNLKDALGRDPTHQELAGRLGVTPKVVANLQKEVHRDLALADGIEEESYSEGSVDEETLDLLYQDLLPEERVVYDYIFGKHGRPKAVKGSNRIDFDAIGRGAGFSPSKARVITSKIKAKLKKALSK
jgi:DNA-directed RNA polymerase specialized sigma subunit